MTTPQIASGRTLSSCPVSPSPSQKKSKKIHFLFDLDTTYLYICAKLLKVCYLVLSRNQGGGRGKSEYNLCQRKALVL
jgi:hypothetical protein